MLYSIGEIAGMLNISPSAIRYYEKEGLLNQIKRESGIRRFTEKDKQTLLAIDLLKETGMSLKDIKSFLTSEEDEQQKALFDKQKKMIENEISALQQKLDFIDQKCLNHTIFKEHLTVS
ncbi:MerR family transcriptional regulator [[Eubacterium] hominis]|uniref:MerR family transcriptional regulator n=1 Tax=[Eubacterium] hominis TaxID=2764325 RepID=UPI003A4D5BEB